MLQHLNPYLNFDGRCEEAINFYAQLFDGKVTFLATFEGTPMEGDMPADWRKKVMHAALTVGDKLIMATDAPPGRYERPQGISVSISVTDPNEADRIFKALADKGTAIMPIQETFWALRFGMCVDRFAIPWMVNCDRPA